MLLTKRTQDFFPTLFNDLFDWNYWTTKIANAPQMNIIENDDEFKMELSVPGLAKEDLVINIDEDKNLVIEMIKKNKVEEKDKNQRYLRREFTSSQFKEILALPDSVNLEGITAKVENGVLEVVLPKIKPEEKAKMSKCIEIK